MPRVLYVLLHKPVVNDSGDKSMEKRVFKLFSHDNSQVPSPLD